MTVPPPDPRDPRAHLTHTMSGVQAIHAHALTAYSPRVPVSASQVTRECTTVATATVTATTRGPGSLASGRQAWGAGCWAVGRGEGGVSLLAASAEEEEDGGLCV